MTEPICGIAWGSHACDLPSGHVERDRTMHRCSGCCNELTDPNNGHLQAHKEATEDQYGADGCAGMWPYYGKKSMVTEGSLPFWRFERGFQVEYLPFEFAKMKRLHEEETR